MGLRLVEFFPLIEMCLMNTIFLALLLPIENILLQTVVQLQSLLFNWWCQTKSVEYFKHICSTPPGTPANLHAGTPVSHFVNPEDFKRFPKALPWKQIRKPREEGRSMIATDSPDKERIKSKTEERKRKRVFV